MSTKGKIYLGDILVSNPPEGSIDITENGTIDVTDYETANVNVAGSGGGSRTGTGPYIKNPINGIVQIDLTKGNFTYDYEIDGDINAFTMWEFSPSAYTTSNFNSLSQATNVGLYGINVARVAKIGNKIRLTLTPKYFDEGAGTSQYSFTCHIAFSDAPDSTQTISCGDSFLCVVTSYNPAPCFAKGTQIMLVGGIKKDIENITYDDDIVVWDFDNGKAASSKPLWITKSGLMTEQYHKITLSDGTVLKLCGPKSHRLLCLEDNAFTYAIDMVGKHTFKQNGEVVEVVSTETIEEEVEYYNIITDYHMNLYANDVLTSCRYSNLYPIQDAMIHSTMKYVKDKERPIVPFEAYEGKIGRKWYDSLRLGEQTIPVEETIKYIERLEALKK